MQFQDRILGQVGLALFETVGMLTAVTFFVFLAFGAMDFYSKTFSVRRITEKVLSSHSNSVFKDVVDVNGDLTLQISEELITNTLIDEVREAQNELVHQFSNIEGENEYRIEAQIRIVNIDAITGKVIGFKAKEYKNIQGKVAVPPELSERYSFDSTFLTLTFQNTFDGASFLAEPSPDKGYELSQRNYLPFAAVSAIRIFVYERGAPLSYASLNSLDGSYIVDNQAIILRGGLQ